MRNSMDTMDENYTGGSAGGNLLYLLAGCGIGAALGLLFAPKAGSELRGDITEITRKGYDETLELAGEVKDHSAELYHALKESADRVYGVAATKLHLAEKAGDLINGEINGKTRTTTSQDQPQKGPGSSNIY